jgi:hypothetical protein
VFVPPNRRLITKIEANSAGDRHCSVGDVQPTPSAVSQMLKTKRYSASSIFPLASLVVVAACSESNAPGPKGSSSASVTTTASSSSSSVPAPTTALTSTDSIPGGPGGNTGGATGGATGGNTGGATGGNTGGTTESVPSAGTSEPPTPSSEVTETSSAGGLISDTSAGNDTGGGQSGAPVFHIFMLMGQSNMAGVAKAEASDKTTDDRIKVLGGCNQPAGQWNVAKPPLSDCPGEKGWNLSDSVDPGTWFAKTIVTKLPAGDSIGLVGTAESGEAIETFITGGVHHQMILNKIAQAKTAPNAHFAGVIFHQGESDNGQGDWPGQVLQLYNEVKAAWGVDDDVPFILGELPAGGCCSGHNSRVHEAADGLPIGAWVTQDGTAVMDEYHFDHASVVLMGQRYGEKMLEKLGW